MITETSNPELWATLINMLVYGQGWVTYGSVHYQVVQLADNSTAFLERTIKELIDSRSIIGSKPASYKDVEIE